MLGFCCRSPTSPRAVPFLAWLVDNFRSAPWWYFLDPVADSDDYYWFYAFGTRSVMLDMVREFMRISGSCNRGPSDLSWYLDQQTLLFDRYRFYWFRFVPTQGFLSRYWLVPRLPTNGHYIYAGVSESGRSLSYYWNRINRVVEYPQNPDMALARRFLLPVRNAATAWLMAPTPQDYDSVTYQDRFPVVVFS